ncbi:MAG: hypothetical protein HZB39_14645 [Planctomycetes bacterium]|nr:hypothetical protein [Planctomycetota bacterium]
MSKYLDLTREFNAGRLRTILCSGQAVVLLRLAIASKDGDWIIREDVEAFTHVLEVLERHGARYRFGAPLDLRWHRHGWSSHFEFVANGLRVRTDFFSRPPRVGARELAALWRDQEGCDPPFTGPALLIGIKQTAREKDWPIVGELARLLPTERERVLHGRSARDLLAAAARDPALVASLVAERPALAAVEKGLDELRIALERERFAAMDADARRIQVFIAAARSLQAEWPALERSMAGLPLRAAHDRLLASAARCLPANPSATTS